MNNKEIPEEIAQDKILGICGKIKNSFLGEETSNLILAYGTLFIMEVFSGGGNPKELFHKLLSNIVKATVDELKNAAESILDDEKEMEK